MLLLTTTISFAQQTVLFDFGGVFNTMLTTGENYNNMTEDLYQTHVGDHSIVDLINDTGANTGFSYAITSNFQYFNEGGTQIATGDAAFFHVNATKDSFFY